MDYFRSSLKGRLLRFALTKTGFLDTDTLDLDKLNFSVGRNSSAEFRDVGLRLEVCPPVFCLLVFHAHDEASGRCIANMGLVRNSPPYFNSRQAFDCWPHVLSLFV